MAVKPEQIRHVAFHIQDMGHGETAGVLLAIAKSMAAIDAARQKDAALAKAIRNAYRDQFGQLPQELEASRNPYAWIAAAEAAREHMEENE